jgi:outer membrane receptor protein involved in Fe transport
MKKLTVICVLFCLVAYSDDAFEKLLLDSAQNNAALADQIKDTVVFTSHDISIEGVLINNETGSTPNDDSIIVFINSDTVSVDSIGEFRFKTDKKPYYQISVKSKKFVSDKRVITFIEGKSNYFITLQLYIKVDTSSREIDVPVDISKIPWTITGTIIDSRFDLVIESDSTVLIFDTDTISVTKKVNFVVTTRVSGPHTFYLTIPGYHSVTIPLMLEEKEKQLFITIPTTILDKPITRREITVSAKRLPVHRSAQVAKIDVPRKELQRTVATLNDPVRVLQTLPGVASESDVSARPIVQGGDVHEARVFLDGVPLLQPYHYGGVRSMFNQQAVDHMTLYKTGFPAEMHNAQSALIDVAARVPSDEKPSFEFDLNLLQYSTYLGFPLFNGKAGLNFSSQGSFHEQILKFVTNIGSHTGNQNMGRIAKLVSIPDYKDFTAGISISPSPRFKIFINEMLNSDRTKFTTGDSLVNVTYNYYVRDQQGNSALDTSVTIEMSYSVWDTAYYKINQPLKYRRHDGTPVISKPWFDIDTIIDYKSKFNVLYTKVQYIPTERSIFNTTMAWQKRWWNLDFPGSYNISDDLFGENKYDVNVDQINLNSGFTYSGYEKHLVKAGAQIDYTQARYDVRILRYLHRLLTSGSTNFQDFWGAMNGDTAQVFNSQSEEILYRLMDRILVAYKGDKGFVNAALYGSDSWDVSDRLHVDIGARVEYSRADHVTSVSPRLTIKYNLSKKKELLGSAGHYTQNNYELDVIALSDKLKPEKVWHATAGIETKLLPWLTQKVDVYGKYYYDLASEIIEPQDITSGNYENPYDLPGQIFNRYYQDSISISYLPEYLMSNAADEIITYKSCYTNDGKGTAFGFEYLLRFDLTDFWHGWFSLSWGKSIRSRREGWRKHPFPLDRPLLISVNNYYRLPRKYELSLKYRYMSGLPYTSVRIEDYSTHIGNYNDRRYNGYQRLDIRFSKGFSVKSVKGNLYTEIWNAFNSPNLFGIDSKTKEFVTILPNFPVTMLYVGVECIF